MPLLSFFPNESKSGYAEATVRINTDSYPLFVTISNGVPSISENIPRGEAPILVGSIVNEDKFGFHWTGDLKLISGTGNRYDENVWIVQGDCEVVYNQAE